MRFKNSGSLVQGKPVAAPALADAGGVDHQKIVLAHGFTEGLYDLHWKANAVFKAAAVFVCAPVGSWVEEFSDVKVVREVEHTAVKAQIFV